MNPPTDLPKTRSDSTIDARLTAAETDHFASELEHGMSIRDAVRFLHARHNVQLSEASVSRWAAKRRRAKADAMFAVAMETLQADRQQAAVSLGEQAPVRPDPARDFAQASLLVVSHALFAAGRDGDFERMNRAARMFSHVQGALCRARRVEISQFAADTARRRFEFSAAEAACDHAEALRKINKEHSADDAAKVRLVIKRLFGAPPPSEERAFNLKQAERLRTEADKLRVDAADREARAAALLEACAELPADDDGNKHEAPEESGESPESAASRPVSTPAPSVPAAEPRPDAGGAPAPLLDLPDKPRQHRFPAFASLTPVTREDDAFGP